METDPTIEIDCFLAAQMSMPLAAVRDMPHQDWIHMVIYFARKAQREELATLQASR